jgi:hypothetical protein
VLKEGRLVGIVSRANLLHGMAHTIVGHHEPGAAKDRRLRDEVVKLLLAKHELHTVLIDVTVSGGNIRLWGVVENGEQAATAEGGGEEPSRREVGGEQFSSRPDVGRTGLGPLRARNALKEATK